MSEINKNQIDPVEGMTLAEIKIVFVRNKEAAPDQNRNETDKDYCTRLKQVHIFLKHDIGCMIMSILAAKDSQNGRLNEISMSQWIILTLLIIHEIVINLLSISVVFFIG